MRTKRADPDSPFRRPRSMRLYGFLSRAYPAETRRRFGAEIYEAFDDSIEEASRKGRGEVARLWIAAISDAAQVFLSRRLPSRTSVGASGPQESPPVFDPHGSPPRKTKMIDTFMQDIRFSIRSFRHAPAFVMLAIMIVALGIGATTTVFSVVQGVLLRPLPYADSSDLVYLGTSWGDAIPTYTSQSDFVDWKARLTTVESLGAATLRTIVLAADGDPQRVMVSPVSRDFLSALGVAPALGRAFVPEEFEAGQNDVALISHGFWMRQWGGAPGALGQVLRPEAGPEAGPDARESFRIVGVMPAGFRAPEVLGLAEAEVWIPLPMDEVAYATSRTSRSLRVVGRLASGITFDAARQEVVALQATMIEEYPDSYAWGDGTVGIAVASLHEQTVGESGPALWTVFAATGLLLLIACANVANLLLARATQRNREIAVRAALGAGRGRIVTQLLTESTLLSLAGGVVGALLALAGVRTFVAFSPVDFPRLATVQVDVGALCFAFALSLVTGLVFGYAPAVLGSRGALISSLKEGGSQAGFSRSSAFLRSTLAAAQIALALVLLVGAGLLVNSYARLLAIDPGFEADGLLLMEVDLGDPYPEGEQRVAFFAALLDHIERIPGVETASMVEYLHQDFAMWAPYVILEGADEEAPPTFAAHAVGPAFIETMGMRLLRGRDFSAQDAEGAPPVVIVSETLARTLWSDGDPVGQRLKISPGADAPWLTVVGVAADIRGGRVAYAPQPELFVPYLQFPYFDWTQVLIRGEVDAGALGSAGAGPGALAGPLRQALLEVDPKLPFDGVITMNERIASGLESSRASTFLALSFAVLSMVLAAGGIYGTMMYAVGQRTREIGIRVALGATSSSVVRLVVRQSMVIVGAGIIVGLVGALLLAGLLETAVFGISPTDPVTFLAVAVILGVAALVAAYLPARRASRVDPLKALRME
jgi:putative ABC transport system permease protein